MAIATVFAFLFRGFHVALLLGMTFEVVAITATLFEQWCAVRKTKKAIYKRKARGKPCLP